MITDAVPLATRAKTQGLVDVAIAIAGATGGLASGVVVATASYPILALTGGILSLAILPAIAATARSPMNQRRGPTCARVTAHGSSAAASARIRGRDTPRYRPD